MRLIIFVSSFLLSLYSQIFIRNKILKILAGNSNIEDELLAIKSTLKEKKESWQSSVNEANQAGEKRLDVEEIESGKVKANLDK